MHNDGEKKLTKLLETRWPAQKHTRIEEPVHEDSGKVFGAPRISWRPTFISTEPKKKKVLVNKKNKARQQSQMQM